MQRHGPRDQPRGARARAIAQCGLGGSADYVLIRCEPKVVVGCKAQKFASVLDDHPVRPTLEDTRRAIEISIPERFKLLGERAEDLTSVQRRASGLPPEHHAGDPAR